MKRLILAFVFLILVHFVASSQERVTDNPQILTNLSQRFGEGGRIEIIQSKQTENMLKMQIANSFLQEGKIPGFRIQIFSQSGQIARGRAESTQASFTNRFPEMNTYLEYRAPNFQVFVGDFRTKNEALFELKRIERVYPRAFIVAEFIQISNDQ